MKKLFLAIMAALTFTGCASAGGVDVQVYVPPLFAVPAPVYVQPRPTYVERHHYYQPAPVVVPRRQYYREFDHDDRRDWRHRHGRGHGHGHGHGHRH